MAHFRAANRLTKEIKRVKVRSRRGRLRIRSVHAPSLGREWPPLTFLYRARSCAQEDPPECVVGIYIDDKNMKEVFFLVEGPEGTPFHVSASNRPSFPCTCAPQPRRSARTPRAASRAPAGRRVRLQARFAGGVPDEAPQAFLPDRLGAL